jgi:hypothetical protein
MKYGWGWAASKGLGLKMIHPGFWLKFFESVS